MKTISYPEAARAFALDTRVPRLTQTWDVQALLWLIGRTTGAIVEIGCNRGLTTRDIATAYPDRQVIAVDLVSVSTPWMAKEQQGEKPTPEQFCDFARDLPNVQTYDMTSEIIGYELFRHDYGPIGLVFVDGDHSFAGCSADSWPAVVHLMRYGGIVVWHDAVEPQPEWMGVMRVLRNLEHTGVEITRIEGTWLAFAEFKGK